MLSRTRTYSREIVGGERARKKEREENREKDRDRARVSLVRVNKVLPEYVHYIMSNGVHT
jgi:hypothetical protein